jgi:hypothetical protein
MKNLTYDQLIKLAPKDRPFQIKIVDTKDKIWVFCDKTTELKYDKNNSMQKYKSYKIYDKYGNEIKSDAVKFTFIDPLYQKPEEIKLGTKVEILESARDIDEGFEQETYICKIGRINIIQNDYRGLWYGIVFDDSNHWIGFPHYCVRPVEKVEEAQEIPELENTLEQLDNLVFKAQDIISKYKK